MNRHAILGILFAAAIPAAAAGQQEAPGPANPFFALCMDTHDSNKRTLPEQAKLLAELGYDGAGHLWLRDVDKRIATLEAAGLKLYQVYTRVTIAPGKRPYDPKIAEVVGLLETLRGPGYRGPVGLQCYGIRGDARDHLAASIRAWRKMRERK